MIVLQVLVVAVGVYAAVGVLFAVWFVLRGAGRLDPVARSAPLRVRLLLAPGAIAVWPALVAGVRRGGASGEEG